MKNKILITLFILSLFIIPTYQTISKDKDISYTERRRLKQLPEYTFTSDYSNEIEKYLLDQFPLRDKFRSIKAYYNYYIVNKKENNNIVLYKDMIFESNYPTNKKSIENYINKTNKLINLTTPNNNIYFIHIPDKNYYLDNNILLKVDYNYIDKELNKINAKKIDIKDKLSLKDYYKTDTHWRQESLSNVIKEITNNLNLPYQDIEYKTNEYNNFYGILYSSSAINNKGDTIKYLTNDILNNSKVFYLENNKLNSIYNIDKLNSFDSYEVFLDGASSFIQIDNNDSITDKELIIIRDSFGSSLTPLLVPYYKKITIIDNRYIHSNYLNNYIEFTNQDVLILNSTLIINNSFTLKG